MIAYREVLLGAIQVLREKIDDRRWPSPALLDAYMRALQALDTLDRMPQNEALESMRSDINSLKGRLGSIEATVKGRLTTPGRIL